MSEYVNFMITDYFVRKHSLSDQLNSILTEEYENRDD